MRAAVAVFGIALLVTMTACSDDGGDPAPDGTPPAEVTSAASARAGSPASSPPAASRSGTAGAGTPAPDGPTPANGAPASDAEATLAAGLGGEIAGGDPNDPRAPVAPIPTPPPGVTPAVDPTTIAPPAPADAIYQLVVDLDPAAPGVQTTRTASVGDRIRAAVVLANIPSGSTVAAFNFEVRYDRAVVVAPSYTGGSSTERNPDLVPTAGSWLCIPAPEGDMDDPGGLDGDGNPSTGQAFLSCFAPDGALEGTQVLGIIEFVATGPGTTQLQPAALAVGNSFSIAIGRCEGDGGDGPVIPCPAATLTIQ